MHRKRETFREHFMSNFAALLENPIITRDTRARWRGRAFQILLGYAGLLSLAMLWSYATANGSAHGDGLSRMARVGHDLFSSLTWIQTLGWMLLAPSLTATSIAHERETGLLESVQMSPLPGWKIIFGKSVSALLFIGLLLAAALPVASICFLMGGVSPDEFKAAACLQAGTALTGAFLGLCCSALCRRANIALTVTFVLMLAWFFGSLWCFIVGQVPRGSSNPITLLLGHTNPLIAALTLTSPVNSGLRSAYDWEMWQVCLAFQVALWPLFIFLAARATKKPLAEGSWLDQKSASPKNPLMRDVRAPKRSRDADTSGHGDGVAASKRANPRASRWEVPLISLIRTDNPVLQREARNKFRLRRLPFVVVGPGAFLLCFFAYWYLRSIAWIIESPSDRQGAWSIVHFLALIVITLACAVMGASGFSREREAGTWEGLGLSLLSAREIVTAKLRAPLLAILLYSVPMWPLLLLCISSENSDASYSYRGPVGFAQATATLLVQASAARFVVALGLFLSWRARRTSLAIGWTVGFLLIAWAFVPAFILSSLSYSDRNDWTNLLQNLHPFFAILGFQENGYSNRESAFLHAIFCAGLMYAAGSALSFAVWRGLETRRFTEKN